VHANMETLVGYVVYLHWKTKSMFNLYNKNKCEKVNAMCLPSLVFLSSYHVYWVIHSLYIFKFGPYFCKSNKSQICFHASKTSTTILINFMGMNDMWFKPCLNSFLNVQLKNRFILIVLIWLFLFFSLEWCSFLGSR
jgi:hypothetical protein